MEARRRLGPATPPPEAHGLVVPLDELVARMGMDPRCAEGARRAAERFHFRLTRFYAERVLTFDADDVLAQLVVPSADELEAQPESWDLAPPLFAPAVEHPLWVQKYRHEGLIRISTQCSSYCRYCYVRERTAERTTAKESDIESVFSALSRPRGDSVEEVILSGGDPLTLPPGHLTTAGNAVRRCNAARRERGVHPLVLSVHTREPVWRPDHFLEHWDVYGPAFAALDAWAYVVHLVHPREVTPELQALLGRIARAGDRVPALLVQHPVFRGVNDAVDVLLDLYRALASGPAVVRPYYMVHPFGSGTPPRYRLRLVESQRILRGIHAHPGRFTPTLIVPTSLGKCYVAPHQPLVAGSRPGSWLLTTKNGVQVEYLDP